MHFYGRAAAEAIFSGPIFRTFTAAAATIDCEHDTADLGRKLEMPLLVLWGKNSLVGKQFADPLSVWKARANNVCGEGLDCGHYVNEEAPEQVITWLLKFLN